MAIAAKSFQQADASSQIDRQPVQELSGSHIICEALVREGRAEAGRLPEIHT